MCAFLRFLGRFYIFPRFLSGYVFSLAFLTVLCFRAPACRFCVHSSVHRNCLKWFALYTVILGLLVSLSPIASHPQIWRTKGFTNVLLHSVYLRLSLSSVFSKNPRLYLYRKNFSSPWHLSWGSGTRPFHKLPSLALLYLLECTVQWPDGEMKQNQFIKRESKYASLKQDWKTAKS